MSLKRAGDALARTPSVSQEAREEWARTSAEIMRESRKKTQLEEHELRAQRCILVAENEGLTDLAEIEHRALDLMDCTDDELLAHELSALTGVPVDEVPRN